MQCRGAAATRTGREDQREKSENSVASFCLVELALLWCRLSVEQLDGALVDEESDGGRRSGLHKKKKKRPEERAVSN